MQSRDKNAIFTNNISGQKAILLISLPNISFLVFAVSLSLYLFQLSGLGFTVNDYEKYFFDYKAQYIESASPRTSLSSVSAGVT